MKNQLAFKTTSRFYAYQNLLLTLRAVGHQHPHKRTDCACVFKFNCPKPPTAMLLVDVIGNTLTTMYTQLHPNPYVMMKTIARVNFITYTATKPDRRRP
jgi:hypothetical protein